MEGDGFLNLEAGYEKPACDKKVASFKWLVKKNGEQREIKMVDMTEDEIKEAVSLCGQMLYNKDPARLGRVHVLRIIEKQKRCCTVAMFMKWIKARYKKSDYDLHKTLRSFVENNVAECPDIENMPISRCIGDICPQQFSDIMIKEVMQACVGALGIFDSRYMTKSIIFRQGIALLKKDIKQLTPSREEYMEIASRYNDKKDIPTGKKMVLEVIKLRLGLDRSSAIFLNPTGLTYEEFRSMIYISKGMRYSDMTTDQLTVLRNKMLLILENEVYKHIKQWNTRMNQLNAVALLKGFRTV